MAMDFNVWYPEEQAMTLDQYRRSERKSSRQVTPRRAQRNGERRA